jgi:hypothetical protein
MRRVLPVCGLLLLGLWTARADEPAPRKDDKVDQQAKTSAQNQEILSAQFKEFEQALLRLAQRLEHSQKPEDRERAANLKKALVLVGEEQTGAKFDRLISLLRKTGSVTLDDLKEAGRENQALVGDLRKILEILLLDNRDEWLRREKARLSELLKQVNEIIRQQKLVRAQTEGKKMAKDPLANAQGKVRGQTEGLAKALGGKGEGKDGQGSKRDPKKGNGGKGNGQGGQGQDTEKGDKKDGQQGGGGDPKSGDSTPGRPQAQEAIRNMKEAEARIRKLENEIASTKQDKAIQELEKLKKKLEEILRQLREEEMERLLAALQARCERMLQLQIEIYEGTKRIDEAIHTAADHKPDRNNVQRSLNLSDRELEIVRGAAGALALLRDEGSAAAFPEAFVQVRDDATHVTRRLGKVDVGSVTQVIEQDIIATLKDMIEALKKKRQDMQNNQGNSSQQQQQNQQLINLLAELKMIRAMQIRVNNRTKTYAREYVEKDGEQAKDPAIQDELNNLAARQAKIFDVTNDIYKGKTK